MGASGSGPKPTTFTLNLTREVFQAGSTLSGVIEI